MWAKAGLEVRVLLLSFFYKRWPEGISSAPSLCSLQHSTASRRTRIMHYAPTNELAKGPKQHQGIRQCKMGCCLVIKNVPFNVVV